MISPETILRAKNLIEGIEKLQNELAALFGGAAPAAAAAAAPAAPAKRRGRPPGSGKKARNMSAEGRARIAAAARARWARFHAEKSKKSK